ncbi:MAG: DUF4105 domain-containing protein [Paludibacteraceae bacterium]|nr:DUF4105 domain-containing protein [Paludibacteraceae bacterium]
MHFISKHIALITCLFLSLNSLYAQHLSNDARISLLTCSPGAPLYFHYGHSALRIEDPSYTDARGNTTAIDWTFNYGVFNFNTEHFYLKFTRGETDYMLALEYTPDFEYSAALADRQMSYQPLLLDSAERQAVLDALLINYRPENRKYRYNFVYDNCATRPWHIIRAATHMPENNNMSGRTWRNNIDYYTGKYTWGRYGINLVFGYEADQEMTVEQSLFLPENLMNYVSTCGLSEDEYITPFIPRDGNLLTSPELIEILLLLLIVIFTAVDYYKRRFTWQLDMLFASLFSIVGIIIFVLYFFSTHPFVGSNLNILLLNPLWLAVVALLCFKSTRSLAPRFSAYLLLYAALCFVIEFVYGQRLHPMSALPVTLFFRWYVLRKRVQKTDSYTQTQNNNCKTQRHIGAVLLLGCISLNFSQTVLAAPANMPRLTVVVAVDGLHQQDLNALRPYWQQGGLRMMHEEAFQTELTLPNIVYGGAETPATLFSGRTPAENGITYDQYFNRTDRTLHDIFEDNTQSGIGCQKSVSPAAIRVLALTDRFRLLVGDKAAIYAIGLDANTTLCMAGHSANTCCWFNTETEQWATTTYYDEGLPDAADKQNTGGRIEQLKERTWSPRMDISQYMCPTDEERKRGFTYTGFANGHSAITNTLVCELALDLQKEKHLGEDATADLLLLQMNVLSPAAKADHINTAEQEDMYLSLNQDLGYLIEQLSKRVGKHNLQMLIVGLPRLGTDADKLSTIRMDKRYFNVDRAVALTGTYLMALYGHERWVDGGYGQSLYLNRTLIEQKKLSLPMLQRQVSDFLIAFEGVQGACPANELLLLRSSGNEEERLQQSLNKRTAGDVVFWLEDNYVSMTSDNSIPDKVADRSPRVPLYLWSGALRQFPEKDNVSALGLFELLFE